MDLKIQLDKNKPLFRRKRQFVWNWQSKSYYLGMLYLFILGVVFLVYGITSKFSFKVISVQGDSTIYNLHIGITIGSILLITAIISLISLESNKNKFFHRLNYADQFLQTEKFIIINDHTISYYDSQIKQEFKWDRFSAFVYKNGFLMMVIDKKVPTVFVIHQSEVNDEQFKNLLLFVRTKMKQID